MNKRKARKLVTQYWSDDVKDLADLDYLQVSDAFKFLNIEPPEALGLEIARKWQEELPPGYVAVCWPENGRMRLAAVKRKFENRFRQMIANPNDTDDIS